MSGPAAERGALLLADDAHDRALQALVHPADWVNPVPRRRYHMVVIGAGTGGLVTAAASAGLGARVALIERHLMGGDCLNSGCVPSKAVISSSREWRGAVRTGGFAEVMARMRRLRAELAAADSAARFRDLGVDVFFGSGRFTSADTISAGEATLRFHRAVIATGGRPTVPAISGLAQAGYLTNETVFALTELPSRMAVIGGGPIGCELAQAFQRLGAAVTLFVRGERILPRDDRDAAAVVAASLADDGVRIVTRAEVLSVEGRAEGRVVHFTADGATARTTADVILLATGRRPNVEGLGLDAAGVGWSERGVEVDDRLRTRNRRVYAVGDVCSEYKFTHAADAQARLVVQNALFFGRRRASRLVIPWCTYTSPELAQVGLTEAEAAAGTAVDVVTIGFDRLDRAVLEGETAGFAKLLLKRGSDRIAGATVVGAGAGDLIAEIGVAMTNGLGLSGVGAAIHPYPTRAEVFRKAADEWRRRKLSPGVKSFLERYFSLWRG